VDALGSLAGRLLGAGIIAVLFGILALPLLVALLTATKLLRYRGWLAGLAFVLSLAFLELSADYLYNLTHWTKSQMSGLGNTVTLTLLVAAPMVWMGVILTRSRRKWLWSLTMLPLLGLTAFGIQSEYAARAESDGAAYEKGITLLAPPNSFVECQIQYGPTSDEVFLLGHVPEGIRVTLLSDPFSEAVQPRFSSGIAGAYRPSVSDPAVLGNVTAVGQFQGYDRTAAYSVGVLERVIARYEDVPLEPFAGHLDVSQPLVQASLQKTGNDPATFDWAHAQSRRATGARSETFFLSVVKPLAISAKALSCGDPALLLSVRSLEQVRAVIPPCATSWKVFQLNDDLYFGAASFEQIPPGGDFSSGRTEWLFRVEASALTQIWPAAR